MSIHLKNTKNDIKRLTREVDKFGAAHQLPQKVFFDIHLALDEILSNIINYGYEDNKEHQIDVYIRIKGEMVEMEVVDDARPFNILEVEDPETEQLLNEKPIGGLGIYLTKKLIDKVEYSRRKVLNQLIMRKKISH